MVFRSRAVVVAVAVFALLAGVPPAAQASIIRDGDPGTIGECLTKPDGSTVTLPCEQVLWLGKDGKSFAVKEWFDKLPARPRLLVVGTEPLPVQPYWSVDLTGTLGTISTPNDDKAAAPQRVLLVSPGDVAVYCDSRGRPLPFIPTKLWSATWPDKRTLPQLSGEARDLTEDVGSSPELLDSTPAPGSRDSLKWLPDGAAVSVNGAIVSASFSDYGFFYVERSDRSFGIWISAPDYVYEGQLVDITGTMATGGGERAVVADENGVSVLDYYNTYPRPTEVGMPNKALGGGAVGLVTRAVADASGLNNTGLLVRGWGKVTCVDPEYPIFYIDDGSAVAAGGGHTGVKVWDLTYDLPSVNDYVIVSGVSAAEWPEGSQSSIRLIWKTYPVTRSTQPGLGTISGTITATGANGKTVRVYCASASTTATFSGNTATYTLSVPYGDHAVTASVLGYKTITQLAGVYSSQPVTLNFTMSPVARAVDVILWENPIPPDGQSEGTVTAIVRDEEGRRLPNEPVVWTLTEGYIVSADLLTDAVGEAGAVVQAPTEHVTGVTWAESAGAGAGCYVEFRHPEDPSIVLTNPVDGTAASGFLRVDVVAHDNDLDGSDEIRTRLTVDGVARGAITSNEYRPSGLETEKLANGQHILAAYAVDDQGNLMRSQEILVDVYNVVSDLAVLQSELFLDEPEPGSIALATEVNEAVPWFVEVRDRHDAVVCGSNGYGPGPLEFAWDGRVAGEYLPGLYRVVIGTGGARDSATSKEIVATISRASPLAGGVFISGVMRGEPEWSREATVAEMLAVIDGCLSEQLDFTVIADPLWVPDEDPYSEIPTGQDPSENDRPRRGIKYWLRKPYAHFFYSTHGDYVRCHDDIWRSQIQFASSLAADSFELVYGNDYWWPIEQRPFVYAVTDLELQPNQYHIVHINSCYSGGWWRQSPDPSIAAAFGNLGNVEVDKTYIGWSAGYYPTFYPILQGLSPNGTGWTQEFWRYLGEGYTVSQAEYLVEIGGVYKGWMHHFLWIYGGPQVTWLD